MITHHQHYLELESIQRDYNFNLKPKLMGYINEPLTMVVKDSIRNDLDVFLERNNLNIHMLIVDKGESFYIVGKTLVDELVWSQII